MKKALSTILNALSLLLLVAAAVLLLNVVLTQPGKVPQLGGYSMLRVLTGSMEPALPTDSLLLIHAVDPDTLEVGDIISFYSSDPALQGSVNTHRIVAITEAEDGGERIFETKGDANMIEDKYTVRAGNILGVVVFSSPLLGRLVRLVSNPYIFLPLILLPLCAILIMNVVSGVRSTRRLIQETEEQALREALDQYRREHPQGKPQESQAAEPAVPAPPASAAAAENIPEAALISEQPGVAGISVQNRS